MLFLGYKKSRNETDIRTVDHEMSFILGSLKTQDEHKIWYTLFYPKSGINDQTEYFLICHGVGSNRSDYYPLFEPNGNLAGNHVALLFEYRKFAESNDDFSLSVTNHDVELALKFLKKTCKCSKINLVGHSFGAAVVSEYAHWVKINELEKLFNKVILISPFLSTTDIINDYLHFNIKTVLPCCYRAIKEKFSYYVLKTSKSIPAGDILIIHGIKDRQVNCSHSERLKEELGDRCILKLIPEEDHLSVMRSSKVWKYIKEFVCDKLPDLETVCPLMEYAEVFDF